MAVKGTFSKNEGHSGSPNPGEPEFLAVGLLRRPHGIQGEIKMSVWTDFPERLAPGQVVYTGETHQPVHIRTLRWHGKDLLISFDEFSVREEVGLLSNQVLMVRAEDLPPLDDAQIYLHELIGMIVIEDATGALLGEIVEIIETGANDVFVVRSKDGVEILLPDIDEVVLSIDTNRKEIRVCLLPGLIA